MKTQLLGVSVELTPPAGRKEWAEIGLAVAAIAFVVFDLWGLAITSLLASYSTRAISITRKSVD